MAEKPGVLTLDALSAFGGIAPYLLIDLHSVQQIPKKIKRFGVNNKIRIIPSNIIQGKFMPKIIIPQPLGFYPDQIARLEQLGEVQFFSDMAKSPEEWLERVKTADIICSGKFGLKEKIYDLQNVFLSLPFVGVGWIDLERLKLNHVTVSNAPGCNKDAVSEWAVFMLLALFRNFLPFIRNTTLPKGTRPEATFGLTGKKVTILGHGNIGTRVCNVCESLGIQVTFFKRGDELLHTIKEADAVIDCLSQNPTTLGLLDADFFKGMKKGSFFVTVTGSKIWNIDAMLEALNENILAGVATDAGSVQFGDIHDPLYQKLLSNQKVLVTPHIAHNSDVTDRVANDMMIENIKAWIKGQPINIVS